MPASAPIAHRPRLLYSCRMTASPTSRAFERAIPLVFVLVWSTGWIVARYARDYADALTFLSVRYALAGAALLAFALVSRAHWPRARSEWGHALFSGILLHGFYLGAVWWAIRHGLPASISALLAALQPILSTLLAPAILGERIAALRGFGVAVGFAGLVVVLSPSLIGVSPEALAAVWPLIALNAAAMVSVTLGTFYQKRHIHSGDLRTVTVLQYASALAVTLPVAYLLEPMRIEWNTTMVLTMAWSVCALSIGAIALLLLLIRRGEVSRSAQLIYLVPPTASLEAFFLFGEQLTGVQIAGMVLTVTGVALASRR